MRSGIRAARLVWDLGAGRSPGPSDRASRTRFIGRRRRTESGRAPRSTDRVPRGPPAASPRSTGRRSPRSTCRAVRGGQLSADTTPDWASAAQGGGTPRGRRPGTRAPEAIGVTIAPMIDPSGRSSLVRRPAGHRLPRRPEGGRDLDALRGALADDVAAPGWGASGAAAGRAGARPHRRRRAPRGGDHGRRLRPLPGVEGLWGGTLDEGRANAMALIDARARPRDLGRAGVAARPSATQPRAAGLERALRPQPGDRAAADPVPRLPLPPRRRTPSCATWRCCRGPGGSSGTRCSRSRRRGWSTPASPTRSARRRPIALDSDLVRLLYNPVAAMPSLHVGHGAGRRLGALAAHALVVVAPLGLAYPVLVAVRSS